VGQGAGDRPVAGERGGAVDAGDEQVPARRDGNRAGAQGVGVGAAGLGPGELEAALVDVGAARVGVVSIDLDRGDAGFDQRHRRAGDAVAVVDDAGQDVDVAVV